MQELLQRHQLDCLIAWHCSLHHRCDRVGCGTNARFAWSVETDARHFVLLAVCGTMGKRVRSKYSRGVALAWSFCRGDAQSVWEEEVLTECHTFPREAHPHVIHVHIVAARFELHDVWCPPHARHTVFFCQAFAVVIAGWSKVPVVAADGAHEALKYTVVVLRPKVDELTQRLLVEVSCSCC